MPLKTTLEGILSPLKNSNQSTLQNQISKPISKWQLPRDYSNGFIGSFKGPLRNCYRTTLINNPLSTSKTKEYLTEYRCIVESSAARTIEVILVTYPNEINGITNCYIIWKFRNSNFQEQKDTESVLIGNLSQDLLITKEEYFNWVMKNLLDYTLIKGLIGNNNFSNKEKYITDIIYDGNKCSLGFDSQKAEECQTNMVIDDQQKMLLKLIDTHNNEVMKRPDYRGPKK